MTEENESQSRIEDPKVQTDRKRRVRAPGHRRGRGFLSLFFGDLLVGATIWVLTAFAGIVAIAIGLGVSLKSALLIAAMAGILALAFAAMSN